MNIESMQIWQPEDGYKQGDAGDPNYASIDFKDELIIIETQRYAFTRDELLKLIEISDDQQPTG